MIVQRLLPAVALFCVLASGSAGAAAAQQDADGSKDHPMVSRFPGYYITSYDEQAFGAYEFDVGDSQKRVEGRYWEISYEIIEGRKKAGPLEIGRNYLKTFTDRGGARQYENIDASGGSLVARLPAGGKNIWLRVSVSNSGDIYELTIVEEAAMEQKVEFSAMELSKALRDNGSVSLHGIQFDTGKATIKPESEAVLSEVVKALKIDDTLKVEIQGHTDNVGTPAANLALSQGRAAAVRSYLVQGGVPPARLTTVGLGDTKPVADNKTDSGRTENRRVELVKK
jgi:OmpA-OmpF porin, OOP family